MDVIWKNLSDNHPKCKRLALYSQSDPGTGATFAVRCNSLMGVTSEENFLNDAMYLVEGVLPLNETLQSVEMEWSFLNHLEEEDRDTFIRGVASLKNVEEISIRGSMTEDSRMRFRSLLQIPECAKKLKHLAIEVDELHVEDPAEIGLAALLFLRCQHLESVHIRGLMPSPATEARSQAAADFDCSILLSALGKLPCLNTVHISRNQENPKTVSASALRDICSLPSLEFLSLMNMGLTDKHCKIFKKCLYNSTKMHSLILVDNPSITERGNKALLRLLEKNRSIYNSTFGTDSETIHRTSQLVHLHLNRCGRSKVQSPVVMPKWLDYVSKINETVPEELELDTLFLAVQENPEMIIQHCTARDEHHCAMQVPVVQQESIPEQQEVIEHESVAMAVLSEGDDDHDEDDCYHVQKEEEEEELEEEEEEEESTDPEHLEGIASHKKLPARKDIAVLNGSLGGFPEILTSQSLDSSFFSPPPPLPYHNTQHHHHALPMEELDELVHHWQSEALSRSPRTDQMPQQEPLHQPQHQGPSRAVRNTRTEHPDGCHYDDGSVEVETEADGIRATFPTGGPEVHPYPANLPTYDAASPAYTEVSQTSLTNATAFPGDVGDGWAQIERITNDILQRLLGEACWVGDSVAAKSLIVQ
mmetsp:Transcript_15738/g.34450  ORF Transcript_15738/g.34450 Transcript_15738/m.34450 type:complete len:646 (-) Transcript_15738:119-2056(-)|eukprot:CAMPEP_0168728112 /NCGR_PEP_ID=MMETSP0724-20121128/5517_1 /TAXON_ID=265536 /ORGANISM="Amphiprora sp., Strain CCMP467" /LENGTH=645 /DNA_ID=CAMNT_0008774949 /DNA_START=147 /DNA_END=2084 /DNA_ORIENTATION=+